MNYYINSASYDDLLTTCWKLEAYQPTSPALGCCRSFVENAVVLYPDVSGWYHFPEEEEALADFCYYLPRGIALPGYLLQNAMSYAELHPDTPGFAVLDSSACFCALTADQMGTSLTDMIASVEQLMKPSQVKGTKPRVTDMGHCCEVAWGAQRALMEQQPGLLAETVEQMKYNFAEPRVPLLVVSRQYLEMLGTQADRYAKELPGARSCPLFDASDLGYVFGGGIEVDIITADGVETITPVQTNRVVCHVFAPLHELLDPDFGRLYPADEAEA